MNKSELVIELKDYNQNNKGEIFVPEFLKLLQSDGCFYRDHFDPGHVTASAILFDQSGEKILMNHHKSLDKWMNFGGHCDGEEDVLSVAIRETMEESGLTAFKPVTPDIVDIDIHTIPANPNKDEPEHEHFDIRYVMQMVDDQMPVVSDESIDLQWMNYDEVVSAINDDAGLNRFVSKAFDIV